MCHGLEQSLIDDSVDQWSTRLCDCLRVSDGHDNIPCYFVFSVIDERGVHTALDASGNILRVQQGRRSQWDRGDMSPQYFRSDVV